MAALPLDKAELIAIFLETFLFGIFFTLFWITLWILLKKQTEFRSDRLLIGVLIFMLILSTSHIIIDFIRIIEAFIIHGDPAHGGAIGYYGQISQPLYIAKNVVFTLISMIGDAVMAWRCYVVYRKSLFAIIVPTMLIVASFISACFVVKNVSSAPAGATIFVTATPWVTTLFVLGLSTNSYCTVLIVYRIWTSMRSLGPRKANGGLMPVIMALVESGGLHATAWLALLITYLSGSNGQYAALDTITPLVGIVYSLIIIQIDAYTSRAPTLGTNPDLSWRSMHRPHTIPNNNNYPLHSRAVDITVTTHRAIHADEISSMHSPSVLNGSKEVKHLGVGDDGLA